MPAKKRTKRTQTAAILTINAAPRMSARGRWLVAAWLRRQASMLVKEGRDYTDGAFRARYLY